MDRQPGINYNFATMMFYLISSQNIALWFGSNLNWSRKQIPICAMKCKIPGACSMLTRGGVTHQACLAATYCLAQVWSIFQIYHDFPHLAEDCKGAVLSLSHLAATFPCHLQHKDTYCKPFYNSFLLVKLQFKF